MKDPKDHTRDHLRIILRHLDELRRTYQFEAKTTSNQAKKSHYNSMAQGIVVAHAAVEATLLAESEVERLQSRYTDLEDLEM